MGELLIDNQGFFSFRLEEAAGGKGDKIIMRGQFARSDKATENKRLYRESLWRREFGRLAEAMDNRRMFGELDHPSDGRTKLQRVSHLVTGLRIDGNEVIGEAEVLDTPNGRILKTLAQAKASVGVSSRGYGSTKTLPDGTMEVQEDFRLDTFDFVADPATRTAYPKVFAEEREHIREAEMELTPEILKRDYPGLVEAIASEVSRRSGLTARDLTEAEDRTEKRMTEQFAIQLRRAMEMTEGNIRSEIRSELLSDPKVAGALGIVEQIVGLVKSYGIDPQAHQELMVKDDEAAGLKKQLEDKTLEVHKLHQEQTRDQALIKELAYKLHLKNLLAKDPSHEAIESLVGDVKTFGSKEEIEKRVVAIRAELERRGGPVKAEGEKVPVDELKRAQEERDALKSRLATAEAALTKMTAAKEEAEGDAKRAKTTAEQALSVAESYEIQLHALTRINESQGLSPRDRTQLQKLCEGAISAEAVDEIIEGYVPKRTPDNDEATRIRERVGRGTGHDRLEEERGSKGAPSVGNKVLLEVVGGPDVGEFDRLAGTGR